MRKSVKIASVFILIVLMILFIGTYSFAISSYTNYAQIKRAWQNNGNSIVGLDLSDEDLETWNSKLDEQRSVVNGWPSSQERTTELNIIRNIQTEVQNEMQNRAQNSQSGTDQQNDQTDETIYKYPSKENTTVGNAEKSLENMISDADNFINQGEITINQTTLSNFSKTMYNILLAVGIVVAVIVGAIIGLKFMTESIEEKVKAKELLVPYIVGCVVVFGGFGIWKLVVNILQNV